MYVTGVDSNRDTFYTKGYSDIILRMTNLTSDECISTLTLHKVWLAPDLKASLISTSALDKDQINTLIKEGVMTFRLRNQPPLQPYSQP